MNFSIPKRYEENILKKKLVRFGNKWIVLAITKKFQLIEFEGSKINNFLNLFPDNEQNPINYHNVQFRVVHTIGYLLCIVKTHNNNLLVIKRYNECFSLIYSEKRVKQFLLRSSKNVNEDEEERWIVYFNKENGQVKKTNFCELCKISATSIESENSQVQNYLHKKRNKLRQMLDGAQKQRKLKLYSLLQRYKLMSKMAYTCKDLDEASPLIRFGSVFKKTSNETLVIGLPILNISQ